ncbi:MAG: ATP-dependent DNA helicase RecG [bacterium]|nr:ATP-dependent DNA helicase RecG [bacterium]
MLTLETDIININRVGASTAKKLEKLGVATARDLLFYFPFRYDDFSRVTPIAGLQAGASANVVGQIELLQNKRSPRRRLNITEAIVSDGTETLKVIWFNQPFIARLLKAGDRVSLAGKVEDDYGGLMMNSPAYEKINYGQAIHTQGLVPNYHLTANLTNKQVRFLIKQIIGLAEKIADWLPLEVKQEVKLISLAEAVKKIHFPGTGSDMEKARERLAFDELFLIQLRALLAKKNLSQVRAPAIGFHEAETKKFVAGLPFKLTDAQRKAAWEILRDLEKGSPMSRLLEGDVGSGKTLVALLAMLNVALAGRQAALMAPTEILARQHYDTICRLLEKFDLKIGLATRSLKEMTNKQKSKINSADIVEKTDIIIGTHALIQEDVKFKNLALAVIDEQHRFGVGQRKALLEKNGGGFMPHLLSLTATPIPRSLALALYGDLDLSILDEMPKNRKKIITAVVPENKRAAAYRFIREQVKSGRQVFVICPLIDLSDKLGVKSVEEEYQKLKKIIFPDLKIAKLHGRLKAAAKEEIMSDFLENKINILVSTSVVEVGLDIPNASVMMIEGADRFGLAQIHQFRGRVGRSFHQSYCFLFADSAADSALKRLAAAVKYDNGFDLAKIDLKFRGPGEVYGTEQTGFPELKMASLLDYGLMKQAREQAEKLLEVDGRLANWPELKTKLEEWRSNSHPE